MKDKLIAGLLVGGFLIVVVLFLYRKHIFSSFSGSYLTAWGQPVFVANFSNNAKYRGNVTMSQYTLSTLVNQAFPQAKTLTQQFFEEEDVPARWIYYPFGLDAISYRMPDDATTNLYAATRAVYRINHEVEPHMNRPTIVLCLPTDPSMVAEAASSQFIRTVVAPRANKLGAGVLTRHLAGIAGPYIEAYFPTGVNHKPKPIVS